MELTEEEYSSLTDDEKRFYRRKQTRMGIKYYIKLLMKKG